MAALRYAPNLRRLLILCAVYALTFVLTDAVGSTDAGSTAVGFLWLALMVALLVIDWRGTLSLAGLIRWQRLPWVARIAVGAMWLFLFPFLIGVYLARATWLSIREGQRVIAERPARIAALERKLGV